MHVIEHPCIPLETPIYGGFNHDAEVDIHGRAHHSHHPFVVEFPSHEGIALHISVRMGHCGEHVIVFNSFEYGHWCHEERHHNPIHRGHHFHMKIKNHHSHFSIHINGHHICHFHHRQPPHSIRSLVIKGDVEIERIHFEHFYGHNGGGVQVGSVGMVPAPMVMPQPAPVVMPTPAPVVVTSPPMYPAPPIVAPPPVVVVEEGHHHHHHRHGLLHHLFHHHHCD